MPTRLSHLVRFVACALAVSAVVVCVQLQPAAAQDAGASTAVQVEQFEPLPGQHTNILNVATADLMGHLVYSAGALLHVVGGPLRVVEVDENNEEVRDLGAVIDTQFKGEVFGGLGLSEWFDIGVAIPIVFTQTSGDDAGALGVDGAALGDIRIVTRVKALPREWAGGFGIAVEGIWYIPSGDTDSFNGEEGFRAEPRLILDYKLEDVWPFRIALNVGYLIRERTEVLNIVNDDVVRLSLATGVGLGVPGLEFIGTVFGSIQTVDNLNPASVDAGAAADDFLASPVETLLGLQYTMPIGFYSSLGAGTGLNDAIGAPTWRVFAMAGFTPLDDDADNDTIVDAEDSCPEIPEDFDGFQDDDGCPDEDNDEDGIVDLQDSCPDDPEDVDEFQDEDGCPDLDNDEDTIADLDDQCPLQPEDMDGFEDEEGCPDPDNDQDGIADVDDQCANDAEDMDGFQDEDGCPDLDNDQDGIADVDDQCINDPETDNGFQDEDGCPDDKPRVVVTEKKIEISETIFFETNKAKIKKVSFPLLDDIVKVMEENPQITLVRIEGHTDDVGKERYNKKLSKRRATAVMKYLRKAGIDKKRMTSQGYGEEKPIADNATEEGKAKNRRVEITILELDGEEIETDY